MTHVRVKGFKIFADRHGKMRCYHRKTLTALDLSEAPIGSLEFFAECARIDELAKMAGPAKGGTLGLLINEYRASEAFLEAIGARSRSDYQKVFDYWQPIADTPLVKFDSALIARIRDAAGKKHGRRFGTYVKQVFSLLFEWGRERGHLTGNPAFGMKGLRRRKGEPEANRPWTDGERHAVETALPAHMALPFSLMANLGLDPQDALSLPKTAIKDGAIDTRRGKTAQPVWMPLPEPLKEALAKAPQHDAITLCANSKGKPWTVSGYRASWRPIKLRLEKTGAVGPALTLKGLRHTVASIITEMGYDERSVADYLGQKTTEMARHYSRRADRTKKVSAIVTNFDAEVNKRRSKVVKPC
jgi:hypothetical protein